MSFSKDQMSRSLERGLQGFAGGVMTAASVWSLLILIPVGSLGANGLFPAVLGFL